MDYLKRFNEIVEYSAPDMDVWWIFSEYQRLLRSLPRDAYHNLRARIHQRLADIWQSEHTYRDALFELETAKMVAEVSADQSLIDQIHEQISQVEAKFAEVQPNPVGLAIGYEYLELYANFDGPAYLKFKWTDNRDTKTEIRDIADLDYDIEYLQTLDQLKVEGWEEMCLHEFGGEHFHYFRRMMKPKS